MGMCQLVLIPSFAPPQVIPIGDIDQFLGWFRQICLQQPSSTTLFQRQLRIENKIKPRIFDEKRGNAALLIKNSGFYLIRDPETVHSLITAYLKRTYHPQAEPSRKFSQHFQKCLGARSQEGATVGIGGFFDALGLGGVRVDGAGEAI